MTWVRIDDHFNEHPKLAAVGPVGWGIWLAGLAYCNRNLTDGFIPRAVAVGFGGDWTVAVPEERDGAAGYTFWEISRTSGYSGEDMETSWVIDRLIDGGLWEIVSGGFRVHDYEDYQPTKAEVLAEREKNKGRLADWRKRKRNAVTNTATEAVSNGATNGGVTGAPYPVPVPVPSTVLSSPDRSDFMEPWMLFEERTKRKATQKVRDWLEDLHSRFSRKELIAAMQAIPNPRDQDWLKKVDAFLEGAA